MAHTVRCDRRSDGPEPWRSEVLGLRSRVGTSAAGVGKWKHATRIDPAGGVPEWTKGAHCKCAGTAYGGSNPPSPTYFAPPGQANQLRAQARAARRSGHQPEAPDHDSAASVLRSGIRERRKGQGPVGRSRQGPDRADRAPGLESAGPGRTPRPRMSGGWSSTPVAGTEVSR